MITILNNQPIRIRQTNLIDESCECAGQDFCQLVEKFDETQFQIKSSNLVSNGDFSNELEGWNVFESISLELVSIFNPANGECDGSFVVSASGGTGPYEFSLDGITFQVSGTFTGLCPDTYYVIAKDSEGNEGVLEIILLEGVVCLDYKGATIQDLIDAGIQLGQLYNCTLGNIQP